MTEKQSSLMQYTSNPKAYTLKKWLIELIKARYTKHDNIVERVSSCLITNKDLEEFGALIAEVFEAGYFKAVNDYKGQAEELGLKIKVVPNNTN